MKFHILALSETEALRKVRDALEGYRAPSVFDTASEAIVFRRAESDHYGSHEIFEISISVRKS